VKTDDMSAAEHRRTAARERATARDIDRNALAAADPIAWQQPTTAPSGFKFPTSPIDAEMAGVTQEDPASVRQADLLREEARQHKRAAKTLERSERAACGSTSASARAACPVLGPLVNLRDIPGGVRATFADATRVDGVVVEMRCHFAYEQTRGFEAATSCAMYMPGVDIRRAADDPASVDITSADARVADELRELSREQAVFASHGGGLPQASQ
jgi:hypothetical protein